MELYEEKQLWAAAILPKSQGHLLCFPRPTRWDTCLAETCTAVGQLPRKQADRQLLTHSQNFWTVSWALLTPRNTGAFPGTGKPTVLTGNPCCRFLVAALRVAWEPVRRCTAQSQTLPCAACTSSTTCFLEKPSAESPFSRAGYIPEMQSDS